MTCLDIARRLMVDELPGKEHHPLIQWGFMLCGWGPETPDEVPWCSAWIQIPPYILGLQHSQSAAARSWITVGEAVELDDAIPGNDIVVLKRGKAPQPGPNVTKAPGHVGFYVGRSGGRVQVLGGNQSDSVNTRSFDAADVLAVRRLG